MVINKRRNKEKNKEEINKQKNKEGTNKHDFIDAFHIYRYI